MNISDPPSSCRILDIGPLTASANMALDDILLEEVASGNSVPTLRFLQFDPPAVLVGRHQDIHREVRTDYCEASNIDVNRRITGGGAILFQSSALGWELFGRAGEPPFNGNFDDILTRIGQTASRALNAFGLDAHFRPRNDIEIDGRKISGTGGAVNGRGFMFQGTLLIHNEIELFLKCLRVPVEKLKKREIESLLDRVCFLNDLLTPPPDLDSVKQAFVNVFQELMPAPLVYDGLTSRETNALHNRLGDYGSTAWVHGLRSDPGPSHLFWSVRQTPSGTMRIHLWVEPRGRRIRQALVTGDFFSYPESLVPNLEAAIKGLKADRNALSLALTDFFNSNKGEIVGIEPEEVIQAFHSVLERMDIQKFGFDATEANEVFFVNLTAAELNQSLFRWLLLPYCSKKLDCTYRRIPDCGRCGDCEFDRMYDLADRSGLIVHSIQSFEHLHDVLTAIRPVPGFFIGSCCEAFYAKHQREMEQTGAKGILINLDSTTCYDLGKGMAAYAGSYDHKTDLSCNLIESFVNRFARSTA